LVGTRDWQYRRKLGDCSYYYHANFSWPKRTRTLVKSPGQSFGIYSFLGGLQFYADSLESAHFFSKEVRQALEKNPLSTASNAATWAVTSSPIQSHGGNGCGAWECIKFTAYMKAALNVCLYDESIDGSSSVTFELMDKTSVRDWAVLACQHLLKSLCSGSIDLHDCIVTSIRVQVQVPN
jgi:hypothetical protein